jgi:hypothetical protein
MAEEVEMDYKLLTMSVGFEARDELSENLERVLV